MLDAKKTESDTIMYRVVVTYGTTQNQTYACVPSRSSAVALKTAAIKLGYRDARVVQVGRNYDDTAKITEGGGPRHRGKTHAGRACGGGESVHDMRPRSS